MVATVARVVGWMTVPVLAAAVLAQYRRQGRRPAGDRGAEGAAAAGAGRPTRPGGTSPVALAAMALVAAVTVVGVVAGQLASVPAQAPLQVMATFVLLSVLLRRDERYWAGLALLLVAYVVVGAISVAGLGHNYVAESGSWRGVRLLVAWGGPEANPGAPDYAAAATHLATLRYGLPLAVTVAVSWVLATRHEMTRLERVALLLAGGTFLTQVVAGATLSAVTFAAGLQRGLPLGVGLAALMAGVFVLFTVGPGAIAGIVTGVGWLRAVQAAESARTLASTLRKVGGNVTAPGTAPAPGPAGGEPPVIPSLWRFLRGNVGWAQKLNLVLVALAFVVLGLLSLSYLAVAGKHDRQEVAFQYVGPERRLPGQVARAWHGPDETVWLVGRDDRLRWFDPQSAALHDLDRPIGDAVPLGAPDGDGALIAVTGGDRPEVVRVGSVEDVRSLATLTAGSEATVASTDEVAVVAESGGRLLAFDTAGRQVAEEAGEPASRVVARGTQVWTLHDLAGPAGTPPPRSPPGPDGTGPPPGDARYRAVERDPSTLAALGEERVWEQGEVLRWESGRAYDVRLRAFLGADGAPQRWSVGEAGKLVLRAGGTGTRYDFHYDIVLGVFETRHGTWLVVDDHTGIAFTPRATPTSYLVRWPGAPPPA